MDVMRCHRACDKCGWTYSWQLVPYFDKVEGQNAVGEKDIIVTTKWRDPDPLPRCPHCLLTKAVAEADAMEAALAAPLFDGVRPAVDAVLNGDSALAAERATEQPLAYAFGGEPGKPPFETHEMRALRGELRQSNERADELRDQWLRCESERVAAVERAEEAEAQRDERAGRVEGIAALMERSATDWYERAAVLEAQRDEARHAKGQMELRWQAAEKECERLRAQVAAKQPDMSDVWGLVLKDQSIKPRFSAIYKPEYLEEAIRACQATHPGVAWCEKCR
jgi:hypothetical protein